MANKDFPRGLWPVNLGGTARPRVREYQVAASATIYQGSPVARDANGQIVDAPAVNGVDDWMGVAAHYLATGASVGKLLVFDDPTQLFVIQSDGSATASQTALGLNYSFAASPEAGNATTRMSTAEIALSTGATTATHPLRLMGYLERIENVTGAADNIDCIVMFSPGAHALAVGVGL